MSHAIFLSVSPAEDADESSGCRVKNKLFTTVPTIVPRINACSDPPSLSLFLTCMEEGIFSFYAGQPHIIMLHGKLLFIYVERKNPHLESWLLVCT
jgi:hypothetical protein